MLKVISGALRPFLDEGLQMFRAGTHTSFFFSVFLCPSVHLEEEKKKKVVRLPVQRSVETGLAIEFKSRFTRQLSRDPDAEEPKPGAYDFLLFLFTASPF